VRQKRLLILSVLFVALVTGLAWAAPRDTALRKKIDEAIADHYLATQFDRAEAAIVDEITACGSKCSGPAVARGWMYVGIIRGSGKNDQAGAKEAFVTAVNYDPNVALDEGLATPQTAKTFAAAKKAGGGGRKKPPKAEPGGTADPSAKMECSLAAKEVQTRRPIPISCASVEEATKAELRYEVKEDKWERIKMKKKEGRFQATIPCTATKKAGSLRFYVRAQDSEGTAVDSFGNKSEPVEIEIVKETDEEAPAFPDDDAPRRCSKSAAGGKGGEDDEEEEEEEPQSCIDDGECKSGKCTDGTCEKGEKEDDDTPKGPAAQNWLGLHVAYDFAIVGGADVCSQESQRDKGFVCFYKDTEDQYLFNPQPRVANNISTGLAPATFRVLLSFDRLVTDNITVGGRLGYAFGGGPPSGEDQEVKFLPYHAELRASYWIGTKPMAKEGFRPYVGISAGAAQVDAKLGVTVGDCGGQPDGSAPSKPGATLPIDQAFSSACSNDQLAAGDKAAPLALDVYKKLGKGFGGIHLGAVYALSKNGGVQLNINVMHFLPTSGQVIEPSLGYVFGL
jgi:hypothetical protein